MEDNKPNCITTVVIEDVGKLNFSTTTTYATEENVDIVRIIFSKSYLSEIKIESAEKKGIISGRMTTKILYKDAEDVTVSLTGSSLFSENFEANNLSSTAKVVAQNLAVDSKVEFTGREFTVSNNITANLLAFDRKVQCTLAETNDKLISRNDTVPTLQLVANIHNGFACECELGVKDQITKLLYTDLQFVPTDFCPLDGYVSISGNLTASILYELEDGGVTSLHFKTDMCAIKGEIECADVDIDTILSLTASLDCSKTVVNTKVLDDGTTFVLESYIDVAGYGFKTVNQEVVTDTYCTTNALAQTYTERDVFTLEQFPIKTEEITAEAETSNADEIIGLVGSRASITRSMLSGGKWLIEGVVEGSIIYLTDSKELATTNFSSPFQIERNDDIPTNVLTICTHIFVVSTKARIKRGDLILIEIVLNTSGEIFLSNRRSFLTEVKIGDPLDYGNTAYQIFIAQPHEDIWSLCKRLKVDINTLTSLNKDLPNPLVGGERIFITR